MPKRVTRITTEQSKCWGGCCVIRRRHSCTQKIVVWTLAAEEVERKEGVKASEVREKRGSQGDTLFESTSVLSLLPGLYRLTLLTQTHKSKNSKLASTHENKHMVFVFLGLASLTQYNIFRFHSFSCKFQNFPFLSSGVGSCWTHGPHLHHLLSF